MTIAIIIACVVILALILAFCRSDGDGAGIVLLGAIFLAFDFALIGAVIYVAYHFITKYW